MTVNVGSVVRFSSTWPKMTVERIEDETAFVVWFDGDALKRAHLPVSNLSVVDSETKAG